MLIDGLIIYSLCLNHSFTDYVKCYIIEYWFFWEVYFGVFFHTRRGIMLPVYDVNDERYFECAILLS